MTDANPYRPTPAKNDAKRDSKVRRNKARWATIGFAIGFLPLFVFGCYGFLHESEYAASLPPGEAACGMGSLATLILMLFVAPFLGMIRAGSGWIAASIDWWSAL